MYAQVFKDSSASIKAWVVRAKAKKPKIEFMDGGEWKPLGAKTHEDKLYEEFKKLHKDMGYSGTLKAEYVGYLESSRTVRLLLKRG